MDGLRLLSSFRRTLERSNTDLDVNSNKPLSEHRSAYCRYTCLHGAVYIPAGSRIRVKNHYH